MHLATVLADVPRLFAFLVPRDMVALCYVHGESVCGAVLRHRPAVSLLIGERVITFDTGIFRFAEAVLSILLGEDPRPSVSDTLRLDQLHGLLPPEPVGWKRRGTIGQERWQRSVVTDRWKRKGAQRSPEMMEIYRGFVRDVLGPIVKATGETELYFSRIPLIRTHFPLPIPDAQDRKMLQISQGNGKRSKRRGCRQPGVSTQRHTDGRFGHPSSEFNIWLPLSCKASGTNSLYRDSTPWSGASSSSPFDLEYGQFVMFYGNQVPHETRQNTTGLTRVSLDLRCIPGSLFQKDFPNRTYSAKGSYYDVLSLI